MSETKQQMVLKVTADDGQWWTRNEENIELDAAEVAQLQSGKPVRCEAERFTITRIGYAPKIDY